MLHGTALEMAAKEACAEADCRSQAVIRRAWVLGTEAFSSGTAHHHLKTSDNTHITLIRTAKSEG